MSNLITSLGRCGTYFLHDVLRSSREWEVTHESGKKHEFRQITDDIVKRFDREKYLEVNGYLRYIAHKMDFLDYVNIIIRDPSDIFISSLNKNPKWMYNHDKLIDDIDKSLINLDKVMGNVRHEPISFTMMTSNKNYLYQLALDIGISDISLSDISLQKRNSSGYRHKKCSFSSELGILSEKTKWFREKYHNYY